jgi:large subunit ribosomal protein L23
MTETKATFRDYDIIRHPVLTEKSTMLLESANSYVFVVDKRANKKDIKEAVEKIFEVEVESVNTINVHGKIKFFRGIKGRRADFKKAIIKVKQGNKIDLGVGV